MNKIVEDNYDIFVSAVNRILDDLYDTRDALNLADINSENDTKLATLESVAEDYETLRRKLLDKKDLNEFELAQFKLIFAKIIRDWEEQSGKIDTAKKELKFLMSKI